MHTADSQGGEEDSDAEEDDLTTLQSIESRLLQHDTTFTEDDTMVGRAQVKNALINAFVRGGAADRFDPTDLRQSYQLHLNVERIRVPEAYFQPAMFGVDSAGLGEVAGWLLNGFEEEQRRKMMQVSFERPKRLLCQAHDLVYLRHRWRLEYTKLHPSTEKRSHPRTSIPSTPKDRFVMGRRGSQAGGVEGHGELERNGRGEGREGVEGRIHGAWGGLDQGARMG